MKHEIPESHPRAQSLKTREKLIRGWHKKIVADAGLIAHGRGEAFDYLIGETTSAPAHTAIEAAAALLLQAKCPVISVNGNVAALAASEVVKLSRSSGALLEVNLFYRSTEREQAIAGVLKKAGAAQVLGIGKSASASVPELESERAKVDPRGIYKADVILVSLEDGDRTEYLVKMGKKVIAIDLNPFSRTAQFAQITIVDNLERALPCLVRNIQRLKKNPRLIPDLIKKYNNEKVLGDSISLIYNRLKEFSVKGVFIIP